MTEGDEGPPVPPFDEGGDLRTGWLVGGGAFIVLGFGLLVTLNLALHALAHGAGSRWGPVWIGPAMGAYAWAAVGFGALVGGLGVLLVFLGSRAPRGKLELPGYPYATRPP